MGFMAPLAAHTSRNWTPPAPLPPIFAAAQSSSHLVWALVEREIFGAIAGRATACVAASDCEGTSSISGRMVACGSTVGRSSVNGSKNFLNNCFLSSDTSFTKASVVGVEYSRDSEPEGVGASDPQGVGADELDADVGQGATRSTEARSMALSANKLGKGNTLARPSRGSVGPRTTGTALPLVPRSLDTLPSTAARSVLADFAAARVIGLVGPESGFAEVASKRCFDAFTLPISA